MTHAQGQFFRRRRREGCLSDLALDQVVAGEPRDAAVDAHLGGCDQCAARLAQFRREQASAAELVGAGVRRMAQAQRRRRLVLASQALLAAAVVLLMVWPRRPPAEREKGAALPVELDIVVKHADGNVAPLRPGDRLQPGEAIRFVVSTARRGRLTIVGIDAAPKVTPYVQAPVERGHKQLMPGSIVLDDTLGAERVVALLCDDGVEGAALVGAARRKLVEADGDPRRVGELGVAGCAESALVMEKALR